MGLKNKYKKSLTENWCLRLKTSHLDNESFDGIITHIKDEFIVLREKVDFEFDGVVILPKIHIEGVRDNKYEKCANEILRLNGEINKAIAPEWLDECETIPQILSRMKKLDIWALIETVATKKRKSAVYIGPLIEFDEEYFSIHCYDAAGRWENVYYLKYNSIFKIEFDSRYGNHFSAFMRSKGEMETQFLQD